MEKLSLMMSGAVFLTVLRAINLSETLLFPQIWILYITISSIEVTWLL